MIDHTNDLQIRGDLHLFAVAKIAQGDRSQDILLQIGLTPENVLALLEQGLAWAIPNVVLGSMIIVPVWFVVYLFKPPSRD